LCFIKLTSESAIFLKKSYYKYVIYKIIIVKKTLPIFLIIFSFFVIVVGIITYLIQDSLAPIDDKAATNWWNNEWNYRVPITVNSGNFDRTDKPAELDINFTQIISGLGKSGTLDLNSLRLIEVNQSGTVTNQNVPFQFDKAANYNQSTNASGKLTFLLAGNTAKNTARQYHLYFGTTGKTYAPATVSKLITTTDNVTHKGFSSIRIATPNGEYYYHKPGGGFATLLDSSNNDWLGWSTATGAEGDYRGIPNMVHPNDGGFFHPGRNTSTTTLISEGPLKATFRSKTNDNQWEMLWELFPSYARLTVEKVPSNKKYWFLYEGTPGGKLDLNSDRLTRSDGTSILASGEWKNDIPGEEWIFVSDATVNKSIYLIHHQEDNLIDAYYHMTHMTVFGFGRSGNNRYLEGTSRQFTVGLVNNTAYNQIKPVVHNAYKPLTVTRGNSEFYEGGEVTPSLTHTPVQPITTTTTTPTVSVTPTPTDLPGQTPSLTPTPTSPTATGLLTPMPTNTGAPVGSSTPSATTPQGNICGKADTDGNGVFTIGDFSEFARAYGNGQNTCADKDVDYGPCGGRDVNRDGVLNIFDFGGPGVGFAQRYYPKSSCAL